MKLLKQKQFWFGMLVFSIACNQLNPVAAVAMLFGAGVCFTIAYDYAFGCLWWETDWMQDDSDPLSEDDRERERLPYD